MSISDIEFERSEKHYRYLRLAIEQLSETDKTFIKENLLTIISGRESSLSLKEEARELLNYLGRIDINKRNGAIAELVVICLLRTKGFSQEYCFRNLEENSAKKGVDGLVLEGEKFWLLESKSSQIGHNNSHRNTIYRAYKGLEKQLSGENEKINNPWRNAYNHTKIAQSPHSLVKRVAELSTNYTNGDYFKIEDNNVIIGSTIIPDKRGNHHINEINFEVSTLNNFIKNHKSKDEIIIAINLQTIEIFLEYLEEIIDE